MQTKKIEQLGSHRMNSSVVKIEKNITDLMCPVMISMNSFSFHCDANFYTTVLVTSGKIASHQITSAVSQQKYLPRIFT